MKPLYRNQYRRLIVIAVCFASSGCAIFLTDTYKTERYQAVHQATLNGERAKMNALLNANPRLINVVDENDNTLLHLAVLRNQTGEVQDLVARHANVNAVNSAGMTPLHFAAKLNEPEITKLLLAHRPDLSIKDHRGWTPLDWAIRTHHRVIEELLREAGTGRWRSLSGVFRSACHREG